MTTNEAADMLYSMLVPLGIDTVAVSAQSWRYGPDGRKRTVFTATIFPGRHGEACERFEHPTLEGAFFAASDAWMHRKDKDEPGEATPEPKLATVIQPDEEDL